MARQESLRSSKAFQDLARQDAEELMAEELEKLLITAPKETKEKSAKEFNQFQELFSRFLHETDNLIDWSKIRPPPDNTIIPYNMLSVPDNNKAAIKALLDKLVVIKLNGGLGTSMGCVGPKSLISVRNELTFLDLTVHLIQKLNQKYGCDVPLVLMNSFNTHEETMKLIKKYEVFNVSIHCFNQSCHPRIQKESLQPVATTMDGGKTEWWYPPGHGDTYQSFYNSGLLDQFLSGGKDVVFISNIDNLGATVDLNILNYIVNPPSGTVEFVMEVTDKTRSDVKGGTLIEYENKIRLLEIAQVPKQHVDEFKSISKFRIFNTNNLWVRMSAIKRLLDAKKMHMEVIINNKSLENGYNVIQLETAVGAAIKNFNGSIGINVPRSRFLPVKKTSDLLLVKSNLYETNDAGALMMSPKRHFASTPFVQLSGPYFWKVHAFNQRFQTIPDILELDHLTVSGDVTFGKDVILKGTVIIIANHGERIDIPAGSFLENKIVSGNLRILDH
ncbi:UTP--glucose-1-phosphate uridylyltransferase-like isoform X2 [Xenia sp. Carnegie-2017]|uniref:UTP--glucose-1-phosphate uridylyltransferase-like isoform X2 n=1 Tax=Xenia sp. Carnegie-2017 TaxID=2897299 RepID=UPI001F0363E6|nr:UTP--glucose-1-phosphate uridylyltransferase-like isoform X2 [Xenia sp. Carnegie-2017]